MKTDYTRSLHRPGLITLALLWLTLAVPAAPSVVDLVGSWEGSIEFGKFKFRMILHIAQEKDGRIKATLDHPDQGMKGMPVGAVLFNAPEVRLEIDQFGGPYQGTLSGTNEISGAFEEGPGGKPMSVVFKRSTKAAEPEPPKQYTFSPGEAKDIRGYWSGSLEPQPGFTMKIGLKIGRLPNGDFSAAMDLLEQGAKDIPATSVTVSNEQVKLEWQAFQMTIEGKLEASGDQLTGDWNQGARKLQIQFKRQDQPASALPASLSFTPDPTVPTDIRGTWNGTLAVQGNKLRLAFKFGRDTNGTYAGTMISLDQGNAELPISNVEYTNSTLKLELKGIRGSFTGSLTNAGAAFDGEWKQMGPALPLRLERSAPKP